MIGTFRNTFWMVLNANPRPGFVSAPKVKHETYSKALAEAKRLASENIGEMFVILKSIGAYQVVTPAPTWIRLIENYEGGH